VDFGEIGDNDPFSPGKRVFFVGKIKKDATLRLHMQAVIFITMDM